MILCRDFGQLPHALIKMEWKNLMRWCTSSNCTERQTPYMSMIASALGHNCISCLKQVLGLEMTMYQTVDQLCHGNTMLSR